MEDLKKLMEEAVERLRYNGNTDGRGNNALADKIEDALKAPELRINTPNGDLVVGVAENEATQAYVCLDTKEAGLIDLFLAEVPGEELKECYPELEENDMRLLMWEDVFSEDYTTKSVIKAEDIKDLNKTMENASNNRTNNYKFIPDITGADTISLGATVRGGTPKYTFGGDIESFTITSDVLSDEQLIQTTGFNSYGTLIFSDQDATNSNYFRIPSLLMLSNGTIVAAADARYGGTHDSKSNIDTAFSSSNDNGITWSTPILPLHFTDYEDQRVDWPTTMPERNLQITGSASFIDPLLIQDASTGRLFLFADVMPAGIGSSNASIGNGYKEIDGNK